MSRDIRVYKFGGASVKDADAVVNVAEIIRQHMDTDLIIVVSAMGKTTNKLEDIFNAFVKKDKSAFNQKTQALKQFHFDIVENLFGNAPNRELQQCIEEYFDEEPIEFLEFETLWTPLPPFSRSNREDASRAAPALASGGSWTGS